MVIDVVIPALNEEGSIDKVIADIPKQLVNEIIIVDNGSADETALIASNSGARVLREIRKGYGFACLKGIDYLISRKKIQPTDIVVFLDADYSDYPEDMTEIVDPILNDVADIVIGTRNNKMREKGSMTIPQVFGNWLATNLMSLFFGYKYSDLGPFRAIKFDKLITLQMQDTTYGWTVEMQIKALRQKLRIMEIPVRYRNRIGKSKVSGTMEGTIMAGYKIISTILKYSLRK